MSLLSKFRHSLSFSQVDPLGGGLAEEIAAEQAESDAITLEESLDAQLIADQWNQAARELEKDPDWFKFSNDE
ncbi:MAG: hypothetical protein JWO61_252 [Candidatus Saccharibacteria bacterium]|nr:hypothetical protein [Candidatus Saccharibacteria bacterium]